MAKFVAKNPDELEVSIRIELERAFVDENVAREPRFVGKKRPREIAPVDVDGSHVENDICIEGGAVTICVRVVDQIQSRDLLPRICGRGHVVDDRLIAISECVAHAVRERELLLVVPHRIQPADLMDDELLAASLWLRLDLVLEELAKVFLVHDRRVPIHDELATVERLLVDALTESLEGKLARTDTIALGQILQNGFGLFQAERLYGLFISRWTTPVAPGHQRKNGCT